jgi:hypothetical protein
MDADATILTIETGVITIIRNPTDRYQQYGLILRRFYLLIKSGQAQIGQLWPFARRRRRLRQTQSSSW